MVADEADGSASRGSTRNASFLLCLAVALAGGMIGGVIAGWLQPGSDPAPAIDSPAIALLNERIDALYARADRQASDTGGRDLAPETGDASLLDDLVQRIQNLESRSTAVESSRAYSSPGVSSSDLVTYNRLMRELDTTKREVQNRMKDVIRDELRSSRKDTPTSSRDDATSAIRTLQTDLYRLSLRVTNAERDIERWDRETR